jgi:hypothetical protein
VKALSNIVLLAKLKPEGGHKNRSRYCKALKKSRSGHVAFIWNEFFLKKEITNEQRSQFEYLTLQFSAKATSATITAVIKGIKEIFRSFSSSEIPKEILYHIVDKLASVLITAFLTAVK